MNTTPAKVEFVVIALISVAALAGQIAAVIGSVFA